MKAKDADAAARQSDGASRSSIEAEYAQFNDNFRKLAEIRFKLLAIVPVLGSVGVYVLSRLDAKDGTVLATNSLVLVISCLALIAAVGVVFYDQRNTDLYGGLIRCEISNEETPIELTHKTFAKTLNLDLVVSCRGVYELKTVSALNSKHVAQLLTYLYLLDLPRGKLVNFRSPTVESQFVNAPIPPRRAMWIHGC